MMKKKPESFDRRLVGFLKSSLGLTLRLAIGGFRRVKRVFVTPKSAGELRADEKARQAGVRRELRGLPTAHDHTFVQPSVTR